MTEERDFDIEDENPNPSEVDDDRLGETVLKPFDPAEVGEDDGSTVEKTDDDPGT